MRRLTLIGTSATAGVLAACTALSGLLTSPATSVTSPPAATAAAAATVPSLRVTRIATGLDIPWDVRGIGGNKLLITERTTRRLLLWDAGAVRPLAFPSSTVWASGETGLMGLVVDPDFLHNRRFYTCSGGFRGGPNHDVRVQAWTLDSPETRATHVRTLIYGLPATSGRHGGCRLLVTSYGALMVGTGDAATGTNPRNLYSLGGKTLRLDRFTGRPWPTNPFIHSTSLNARYVVTYGHRNVQGLAQRPDGSIWSVEQGTYRDDEVNRLSTGGDYGYNPLPGRYNESVPMTDQSLPGTQIAAKWRSGPSTIATSGGTWVVGSRWGSLDGTLAVAALKGERLTFLRFSASGTLQAVYTPAALRQYGRLRAVTRLGNGDLLVTTSNGDSTDAVLRVTPAD
jgi:glucose/arabinose dehydrogenase